MCQLDILLYYTMTEMLSDHRSSTMAYPEKFVLSTAQYDDYLRCIAILGKELGRPLDPASHMGVCIEIDANSAGFMLTNRGHELPLA